ncbi:DNA mismatch repair endonuclease MutL [Heliophilum fasciatum]|uniref:DNA mismatch repair protein MutL n=1 Tax=Heliophilum fasciatum TaxID=35700 RepID=A0A4R2R9G3_9FIRM|nr:DNA mismatch repair endonuclease MutL [Heliophilum fasciatum]MCW2279451.1 DNA mismatch repair protein MutL [Heliophilum fasciatum]TCP59872.1 DNA mismatch repair protein MutL [Heliophilum fasciatum]
MGLIHVLDTHTANQIAAGEVVERPVSVVKELVENALDAQAKRITIRLIEGGRRQIQVVDDGVGMAPEDALLSVERHATSKITRADDLWSIDSLGFRGEALPSIASISRMEIITRRSVDAEATRVVVEGGVKQDFPPTGAPIGTTVTVEDLFFNTPARRKFLRSASSEGTACAEVIGRLAIAHPDVAFQLMQGGQITLQTPGRGKVEEAIAAVFGRDMLRHLLPVEWTAEQGWTLHGFIGQPSLSRANRAYQTWYVNRRWIRSKRLSQAVEAAYSGHLMSNRFPVFVLHLTFPPGGVDINVHPTKMEVKLDGEETWLPVLTEAIRHVLGKRSLSIPYWEEKQHIEAPEQDEKDNVTGSEVIAENPVPLPYTSPRSISAPYISGSRGTGMASPRMNYGSGNRAFAGNQIEARRTEHASVGPNELSVKVEEALLACSSPVDDEPSVEEQPALWQAHHIAAWVPIGQFRRSYIVAEAGDTLFLIDQHAAHERVLHHQLMAKAKQEQASQELLLPVNVTLTPEEFECLMDALPSLRDAGVIIEYFGGYTVLIRAVPVDLPPGRETLWLGDFLERRKQDSTGDVRSHVVASLACQGAVKAGQSMTHAEMMALLQELARLDGVDTCPHGRPYLLRIQRQDLERRFGRT